MPVRGFSAGDGLPTEGEGAAPSARKAKQKPGEYVELEHIANPAGGLTVPSTTKYRFRARDTIGAADAIEDRFFLDECFVDIGDISTLLEPKDHRRIALGRTGAGKTALLTKFAEREYVISVRPEALSLDYIANSTIVPYLHDAGVKLDIFFRMLWRHVFALEFIKARFHIDDEGAQRRFFDNIVPVFFRNPKHIEALEYFREWGGKFWAETETRIKEVTTKFQSDIEAALGAQVAGIGARLKAGEILSEEEKAEVVNRAQKVVNSLQMRRLTDMIDVLKHCFDEKQRYYIVIDRLDEYWVDDSIRYQLIRALIETIRDFARVHSQFLSPRKTRKSRRTSPTKEVRPCASPATP
ncbi:MAG: hypothetical protein WB491_12455, partial [Candidatus Aquilonibacter sp.]